MQHDVFTHPRRAGRSPYPYIVVLQSDFAGGDDRLSAPMVLLTERIALRGVPVVMFDGQCFAILISQMLAVSARFLRRPLGSVASYRDDIVRELDWLFNGI